MVGKYRQPEFLTENDQPIYRIRCPIHGFIHYSNHERKVIDHRLFRRLRFIRQLALTELIYPGAMHTRFEHSLGVMEVATKLFDNLAAKYGSQMERIFLTVAGFEKEPMARARQCVRLAALLHDIGHASFSHAAEKAVNKGVGHETLTCEIVEHSEHLGGILDEMYGEGTATLIAQIVRGERDLAPQLSLLHDLISGEMDADRTDYLIRDSHHCGVDYGHFDYRRMIESIALQENDLGGLEVALSIDGIHTFEALILARYQMNTQVYYHRLRQLYDEYLVRYHYAMGEDIPDTAEKVIAQNDITMLARMTGDSLTDNGERSIWAKRIIRREHHRLVHDTGVNATLNDIKKSKRVFEELEHRYPDRQFIITAPTPRIHKLPTPESKEDDKLVDLQVIGRNGRGISIGYESRILSKVPDTFRCAQIFVDVGAEETTLREEITTTATSIWKE